MASAEARRAEGVCARAFARASACANGLEEIHGKPHPRRRTLLRALSGFVVGYMFLSWVAALAPQLSSTCSHQDLRLGECWIMDPTSFEEI